MPARQQGSRILQSVSSSLCPLSQVRQHERKSQKLLGSRLILGAGKMEGDARNPKEKQRERVAFAVCI